MEFCHTAADEEDYVRQFYSILKCTILPRDKKKTAKNSANPQARTSFLLWLLGGLMDNKKYPMSALQCFWLHKKQ